MSSVPLHAFEQSLVFDGAAGRYTLVVPPLWEGQPGVVYGGFTAAVIVHAAGTQAPPGGPASMACQFLRPLRIDQPIDIDVSVVRRGQLSQLLHVTLGQANKLAVDAQVRTSATGSGPTHRARPLFELGDPMAMRSADDLEAEDGWERVPPGRVRTSV